MCIQRVPGSILQPVANIKHFTRTHLSIAPITTITLIGTRVNSPNVMCIISLKEQAMSNITVVKLTVISITIAA